SSSKNPTPPQIYTLSLHDALPISGSRANIEAHFPGRPRARTPCLLANKPKQSPTKSSPSAPQPKPNPSKSASLAANGPAHDGRRSEEHTSELQSLTNLVCRLLLET